MSEEHTDSNSSGYYFDNPSTRIQSSFVFSGPIFVILMVMMVTLVVVIVLGNALVILAFKVDKSLRRQCNYYFLNLAISDFLVGEFNLLIFLWRRCNEKIVNFYGFLHERYMCVLFLSLPNEALESFQLVAWLKSVQCSPV